MTILLTILHIIVCLLLIAVILLQVGRGHGLSGASFGSESAQSIFGTKTGDILSKATSVAAIVFLLTTISLDLIQAHKSRSLFRAGAARELEGIDMEKMKAALEKVKQEAQERETKVKEITETLKKKKELEEAAKAKSKAQATPSPKVPIKK